MFKKAICFDDVLLAPAFSSIKSREEIDLTVSLGREKFTLPIVSSPMDTVTESSMSLKMIKNGGLGIIHRYNSIEQQSALASEVFESLAEEEHFGVSKVSAAIGVSGDFLSRASHLFVSGVRILCVDVAHGHHSLMEQALKKLKDKFGDSVHLVAGNVATVEAFNDLSDWGADSIRVGIGGGSICSTRIQTGHGVPTLQSIIDCAASDRDSTLIADGGIKTAGDIVKALAAGADMVMLGSMLAGTSETPGQRLSSTTGQEYKVYRGMASPEAQISWRGQARSLEGVSTTIPYKGGVTKILNNLKQNIKSGLSYTGARNIRQLQNSAKFILQTNASMNESRTHILNKL